MKKIKSVTNSPRINIQEDRREYFHGFEINERQRLLHQAEVLAPLVYNSVDFSDCDEILEIGSGVGAQTLELLKRYPKAHITCVEKSSVQLETAKENLKDFLSRVRFIHAAAENISLPEKSFDGVFICWVLEHVSDPLLLIAEAKRLMRPNARIYIREVFNTILFASPHEREISKIWDDYNERQIKLGGYPFVGAKLGDMLSKLQFDSVQAEIKSHLYDRRDPSARLITLDYWQNLFLSGLKSRSRSKQLVEQFFLRLKNDPDSIFVFGFAEASARTTKLQDRLAPREF